MKANHNRSSAGKKKLWKNPEVINELFSNEEWQAHKQDEILPKAKSEKMYNYILEHAHTDVTEYDSLNSPKRLIYRIIKYASAAIVFVALGFGLWTFRWRPQPEMADSIVAAAHQTSTVTPVLYQIVSNTTRHVKQVCLPDLSMVDLYPGGKIKYERGFRKTNRDIYLSGKAYFKVRRNPARPFSVFAGGLKTTALGTSFTINTVAGHHQTSVKLHTGKIVVAPELPSSPQKPVYLTLAESGILYNRALRIAGLIHGHATVLPKVKPPVLEKVMDRNGNILTMKNIPLAEVISLLCESYHVSIQSDIRDIENITYTGVVNLEKENVESVLQVIALINNMTVSTGEPATYKLQKSNK